MAADPTKTLRLFQCCDAGNLGSNDLGYFQYIIDDGWESACANNPHGAGDIPALDETIAAGCGFVISWACGLWGTGLEEVAGNDPRTYADLEPTPRSLEHFDTMDALTGGGFVEAMRIRTDECRAQGNESGIYVGALALAALDGLDPAERTSRLNAILGPIIAAGFDWVGQDLSGVCTQLSQTGNPITTAPMHLAERCLALGIAHVVESFDITHPGLFPWYNGRFGAIGTHGTGGGTRWDLGMNDPGWFGPAGFGAEHTCTGYYAWLQGSVPVNDRKTLAETVQGDGHKTIVELGGVEEAWWNP